jgi:hypothetical protein
VKCNIMPSGRLVSLALSLILPSCTEIDDYDLGAVASDLRDPTAVSAVDLPGMVQVEGSESACSAMVITNRALLTAAHCLCEPNAGAPNGVVCESEASVVYRSGFLVGGGAIHIHPQYIGGVAHDLAIVTFEQELSSNVTPFIVANETHPPEGTRVMVAGFGYTGANCNGGSIGLGYALAEITSYDNGHDAIIIDSPQHVCDGDSGGAVIQYDDTSSPQRLLAVNHGEHMGWDFDWSDYSNTVSATIHGYWIADVVGAANMRSDLKPSGVLLEPFFAGVGTGLRIHRVAAHPGDKLVFTHHDVDPAYGDTSVANWLSADVNGDGLGDLVQPYFLGAGQGLRIHTVIAQVDGSYDFSYDDVDPNYGNPSLVNWKVADVNGDGKDDLVEPFRPGPGPGLRVHKLLSNGSGGWTFSFANVDPNYGNANLAHWKVADINGDGRDDLVEPWHAGPSIGLRIHSVLATSGGGWTFSYQDVNSGYGTTDMIYWKVGDVNGDGRDDLVEPHYLNPGLRIHKVLSGSSSGASWTFSYLDPSTSYSASTLANWKVGDINADGRADLVEPYFFPASSLRIRSVTALSSGGWTYSSSVASLNYTNSNLSRWKVMDVDGDERADLVEPAFITGQGLRIRYARSTGTGGVFTYAEQNVNPGYGNTGLTKWVVGGLEPRVTQ